jgi:hypothetical protein
LLERYAAQGRRLWAICAAPTSDFFGWLSQRAGAILNRFKFHFERLRAARMSLIFVSCAQNFAKKLGGGYMDVEVDTEMSGLRLSAAGAPELRRS